MSDLDDPESSRLNQLNNGNSRWIIGITCVRLLTAGYAFLRIGAAREPQTKPGKFLEVCFFV
ncbi:hypothetical protein [Paenibacillus macerans]|uniref:hypothetical protein n=1 Tax=Paenibacillus macerans TaxID=44252 RepID=UPI003D31F483